MSWPAWMFGAGARVETNSSAAQKGRSIHCNLTRSTEAKNATSRNNNASAALYAAAQVYQAPYVPAFCTAADSSASAVGIWQMGVGGQAPHMPLHEAGQKGHSNQNFSYRCTHSIDRGRMQPSWKNEDHQHARRRRVKCKQFPCDDVPVSAPCCDDVQGKLRRRASPINRASGFSTWKMEKHSQSHIANALFS